ncbi:MAG TPA: GNAT family N-acetyltransferase [Rhizobiaceae bacterium]|nr:GNAT family N-acetyltransferase [Rhizobiaceae bacterium]
MSLLRLRRFDRLDIDACAHWFDDAETARWVSALDKDWLDYVSDADGGAVAEIATLGNAPVALLQYDVEGDNGVSLLITVDPQRRRQGVGRQVLDAFLHRAAERFEYADAYVAHENAAALALVRHCRFRPLATDAEGFIQFRRLLRETP